jgi:hypothetical protein
VKKNFWTNFEFKKNNITFYPTKIWYGIRDPEKTYCIPDHGSRGQKDTGSIQDRGSGSATKVSSVADPDPQQSEQQDPDLTHGVRL